MEKKYAYVFLSKYILCNIYRKTNILIVLTYRNYYHLAYDLPAEFVGI